MENTPENVIDSGLSSNQLAIAPDVISNFNSIRKWSKFLSIMGFIGIALLVVAGIGISVTLSNISSVYGSRSPFMGYIGFIYIILALVYFFPVLYLFRFSTNMKKAIEGSDNHSFSLSINNLKQLFAFMGIITIVILSI